MKLFICVINPRKLLKQLTLGGVHCIVGALVKLVLLYLFANILYGSSQDDQLLFK